MSFLNKSAVALALCLAVSATAALTGPAAAETVLNRGFGSAPSTLDPQLNTGARENYIVADLFEALLVLDPQGNPQPGAAEKWETSADGLTWTFHLRPGLKWSNGDPMVAADFVRGIVRALDPEIASNHAYYLTQVLPIKNGKAFNEGKLKDPAQLGAAAPDDRTVVLTLDYPMPDAPYILDFHTTAPVHEPSLKAAGNKLDYTRPELFVGNGAYMLKEYVPQSKVVLVKNPHYWDAANVKIDTVVYHVTEDVSTELKRYLAGELDTTMSVPAEQLEKLKAERPQELHQNPTLGMKYLSFQPDAGPLSDIRVRKALAYAIDRDFLQEKIEKAGNVPMYTFSINQDPSYKPGKVQEAGLSKEERLAEAKKLLAEAGYGPDKPLELEIIGPSSAASKRRVEGIVAMWKQNLGVRTKLDLTEVKTWLEKLHTGTWQVCMDSYGGDYPQAKTWLDALRYTGTPSYHWKDDEYEKLMDEANANAADKAKFYELLGRAEQRMLDQYVFIPITVSSDNILVQTYVKGWGANPIGHPMSKYLSIEK
ncbi:peptide ABC transporter substrate-binding protein [Inquilinus limosus]|uniref:peptide ABC transporter substrate-binding protein n=1 Tax=Inquilinus limosus TaxID=171674 RepID=UPI003F140807